MELSSDFRWHALSPSFRDALAPRLCRDRALLTLPRGAVEVAGLDGAVLLQQGCVPAVRHRRGALLACVDLEALLAHDRREELLRSLAALERRGDEESLTCLRLLLGPAAADRTLVLLLLGQGGAALRARHEAQPTPDLAARLRAARVWRLLGEREEAERALQAAEAALQEGPPRAPDLIACAAAHLSVRGDEGRAELHLRTLEQGVPRADAAGWILLAEAHLWLRGDRDAARRCLAHAAEDPAGLAPVAAAFARLLPEDPDGAGLLDEAEARADGAAGLAACAALRCDVRGDEAGARALLDRAGLSATDSAGLVAVARVYDGSIGDRDAAARAMAVAAARCGDDEDAVVLCARAYRDVLGDAEAARAFLRGREAGARGARAFAAGAAAWLRALGDAAEARRCMGQAEREAHSAEELIQCAELWGEVVGDPLDVRRCLEAAEARAAGPEIAACAAAWERLAAGGGGEAARACLRRGEERTNDQDGLLALAAAWLRLDGPGAEGARRCLAKAEDHASAGADLLRLATAWEDLLGESEAARRCRLAELTARARGDLAVLVAGWRELLGEPEARARLQAREAEAVGLNACDAWDGLAAIWQGVLGDEAQAERCRGVASRLRQIAEAQAAEASAETAAEQLACARRWQALGDREGALRCLRALEERAGDDLVLRAQGWRDVLGEEEARARLRALEGRAAVTAAWEALAAVWQEVLGDAAQAERCREEADRMRQLEAAMQGGNWQGCAQLLRRLIADEAQARARFQALESRATTLQDWTHFAQAWRSTFDSDADARRCMKMAESKVRFKSDWRVLVEAWHQLGDYAEAERCHR